MNRADTTRTPEAALAEPQTDVYPWGNDFDLGLPPTIAMTRARAVFLRPAAAATFLVAALTASPPVDVSAQSLRGSSTSLDRQNASASAHDYTYIDTGERVLSFAEQGWLVRVRPNQDFDLHAVSYPYARPEVALFIRRLAAQYRASCGEQLVVTSLTRPTTRQPRNASARSVHPTGMAVDLRYSRNRNCRAWLEDVLLGLEAAGVVEATRERYPAHYHVAVFPQDYARYVGAMEDRRAVQRAQPQTQLQRVAYTVRRGDSLWTIARSHNISVDELRAANNLRSSRIYAGQVLDLPR